MLTVRFGLWPRLVLLLAIAAPVAPASAAEAEAATALCERAIVNGAARAGIPTSVLNAVSLTETGRNQNGRLRPWPWAINREGRGYWFATREEALAFAQASLAEGRNSFDVGCFQINYRWHGERFPSLEAMFDQDQGGDYAARFLRDLYGELGDWSAAAGAYHSRTPQYARIYRARFDRILASLGDEPLTLAALAPEVEKPATNTPPRKSRTKLARRPLIITIDPRSFSNPPPAGPEPAAVPEERADLTGGMLFTRNETPRGDTAF